MFRLIRIALLSFVLVNVAVGTWLTRVRSTSWERPLRVTIFPIAADVSPSTVAYVSSLSEETFAPIVDFVQREARHYGLARRDLVEVALAARIDSIPPRAPEAANALRVMLWSLRMRYWAWWHGNADGIAPDIRVFVLYHDPALVQRVPHSLGLQKGLIGVVYAFASVDQAAQNNIVIAHEFLHTLGATDKYDARTNRPLYPDGFAEPDKNPVLPQRRAEIMAGRIPVSQTQAEMPPNLASSVIGAATAREIRWID